jgi:sugar/nucleoside kinase (ribokinase family)
MIVCLGDLVEDVVVWLTSPIAVGTDTPATITRCRGGSAANVAAFLAAIDAESCFVGSIGDDALGDRFVAEMDDLGVTMGVHRRGRTGSIVVIVSADGERSFLTDRGSASQVDPVTPRMLEDARWLHVPAYCLVEEPLASTATDALSLAKKMRVRTSVDCSSTAMLKMYGVGRFLIWLNTVAPDVVFANDDEAVLLGLQQRWKGPGLLVVKHGPDPVEIIDSARAIVRIPVPPVTNVLDATGAGDAFAAGFLQAFRNGVAAEEAVVAGNRLAARVLMVPGASL